VLATDAIIENICGRWCS